MRGFGAGLFILIVSASAGCHRPATPAAKDAAEKKAEPDEHTHGAGPHGGTVADWGGKYHLEFTVDHGKQLAVVYILGGDAKKAAPIQVKNDELLLTIKEPAFELKLKADPQPGDPAGKASRFAGTHEKLGKEQEFAGTLKGEMGGLVFSGDFQEEPEVPAKKGGDK